MSEPRTTPNRRRLMLRMTLSTAAGVILLVLLARAIDLRVLAHTLGQASPGPLVGALIALALDFFLRAIRFWIMLEIVVARRLPMLPSVAPFVASFGMSDILPLRMGDGLRVLWFSRRFDLPAGAVVGAMIVERVLDVISLLVVGYVAFAWVGNAGSAGLGRGLQLAAAIGVAAALAVLFMPALASRLALPLLERSPRPLAKTASGLVATIAAAIRQIGTGGRLFALLGLSVFLWMLEAGVMWGAWVGLGASPVNLAPPAFAFTFATLGTLVPSLPGHFGAFEFAGVQAFAYAGVDRSFAAAVILVAHLILWAPTALFAVLWLLVDGSVAGRARREPKDAALQGQPVR